MDNNNILLLHGAAAAHNFAALEVAIAGIPHLSRNFELGRVLHYTIADPGLGLNSMQCFLLLLEEGAGLNHTDENGNTPLHIASMEPVYLPFLLALTERGAHIDAQNHNGQTPLHLACRHEQNHSAQHLLHRGANLGLLAVGQETPIHYACEAGREDNVLLLLNHGAHIEARNEDGHTPLHVACLHARRNCVQHLVHAGAEKEAVTNNGETPLILMCQREGQRSSFGCLTVLLHYNANVNARDAAGLTALHHASSTPGLHDEASALLGLYNANPNIGDVMGRTPLHRICSVGVDHFLGVLLGRTEVNPSAVDHNGDTPLHCAAQLEGLVEIQANIISRLLEAGANRYIANRAGQFPVAVASSESARILLLSYFP